MPLQYTYYMSPVGRLKLVASSSGLLAVLWQDDRVNRVLLRQELVERHNAVLLETCQQLEEYFAGARTTFSVPLQMSGTAFEQQVWRALLEIPYGTTATYGDLARRLGKPSASRAVGAANGRNPLSIVVPCHRVVGSTGKLTGFAGGLPAKEQLLRLEGSVGQRLLHAVSMEAGAHPA